MRTEYNIVNKDGLSMDVVAQRVDDARGTVVLHHGYVGNMTGPTIKLMAQTFNDLGLDVHTPDTTHNYNDSDGDYRYHTLTGHCNDLEDVVKHVVDSEGFAGPLLIAGHSAGGHSALVVSSRIEEDYRPALTIASAPLISGDQFIKGWKETISAMDIDANAFMEEWKKTGYTMCESDSGPDQLELHWSVMQEWCNHDLIKDGVVPQNSTILIGGATDLFIPPKDILDYHIAAKTGEAHIIPNGNHSYTGKEQALVQQLKSAVAAHPAFKF